MDYIYLGCMALLCVITLVLWTRLQKVISPASFQKVQQERDALQLAYAKLEQRELSSAAYCKTLEEKLERERQEILSLNRSLESTNAYFQAQHEKFEAQKAEIAQIKSQFNTEFQLIANKILEEKSQKFVQTNQQNIALILDPLREKIKGFEDKVDKSYQTEAAERNALKGVVLQLMEQSMQIKNEANNLSRALKGDSKKQGNWGEVILERVLERSGLQKDSEYRLQVSFQTNEGARQQPDAIIDLPENKNIVVDSKVSLVAYEKWINALNEEERALFAKQHIQSIENHVKDLSAKNYQDLYQISSPDFVLLFMPIESALSMSVQQKPDLFSEAWDRNVVIVSPSTLLATLRTIASIWKQERQTRNVIEIAKEAGALYDKFVGFLHDMEQVQTHIERALRSHEDASKKLSSGAGNVIKKIDNLKKLGAKANKQIDPRYLDTEEEEN